MCTSLSRVTTKAMSDDLRELERRVGAKWRAAAAAREPQWESVEIDMSTWADVSKIPLPANALETSTVGQPLPPPLPSTQRNPPGF